MALRAGYYGLKRFERNKLSILAASTPTDISPDNPIVGKNDVLASVDLMKDTTGWIGKQKITFPYYQIAPTFTRDGVTYTTDDKGVIIATTNGQAATGSGEAQLHGRLNTATYVPMYLPIGKYAISPLCSDSDIRIQAATTYNGAFSKLSEYVYGTDVDYFEITANTNSDYKLADGSVLCAIYVASKNTTKVWDNIKIYPLICDEKSYNISPSFEPYHESVEDWYWDNNAKIGVHQYIDIDDIIAKSGAVLTLNDTGFRCVVGTATSWCGAVYRRRCPVNTDFELKLDAAITSGITYISVKGSTDGTNYTSIKTSDVLTTSGSIDIAFNTGNYTYLQIEFFTTNASVTTCDVTITNLLLKLANDTSDAVTDFTMTNRELTEKVFEKGILTSSDALNNITKTGIYGITTAPTDSPEGVSYCTFLVQATSNGDICQIIFKGGVNTAIYVRSYGGNPGVWSSWYKFTGTEVTPENETKKKKVIK